MLISILAVSGLSFSISQINIIDYKAINKSILDNNIYEKYNLEIPESEVGINRTENRSLTNNLYLVKNPKDSAAILIVENKKIKYNDLDTVFIKWRKYLDEIDLYRMISLIHIDKNISMEEINKLRLKLSSIGATRIAYAVLPANRKYDKRYYRNYGFQLRIPIVKSNSYLPPPPPQIDPSDYENFIKIELPEDDIYFINETYIDRKSLAAVLKALIKRNKDYIVQISTCQKIKFSSYFTALSS